jgi:hypothetical protein
MKKTLLVLAMVFFAFIAEVESAPVFNALDRSDPLYAEYQQGLCAATYDDYRRFAKDRFEMDRWSDHGYPILSVRSEADRQAWIADWVITTELRDQALQAFNANCR